MIGPLTLLQLIEGLDSLDGELTVFWKSDGDLSSHSTVFVVNLDEEAEPEGLKEFIDIWHICDVIKGKGAVAGLVDPDVATKLGLLLDYAEKGA